MFEHIQAAQQRLKGYIHATPVMTSSTINEMLDAQVYFKCENFQRAGAFKFRGAFNAIANLSSEEKANGIIAYSSGNHAQGVALVGQLLGLKTTIVMPNNAPRIKRNAVKTYGADIVEYDVERDTREHVAEAIIEQYGYTLIPPFNHIDVVAGQGTAAAELFAEVGDLDMLLTPCGGGGLLSGSAIAAKYLSPACRVVGIEPELADDATRSFRTKTLQTVNNPNTIADGTRTASLGELTFQFILQYVDDMQTVSEAAIMQAVQFFFYRMKLVVEPSGALGLAALLSRVVEAKGKVGIIVSGGNIDAETMHQVLSGSYD